MVRSVDESEIPTGWKFTQLDQLAKRKSGHTPSKSFPEYWDGGIKWISLTDSSRLDDGYISETAKEISQLGIENSSAELLPAETVVLSRDAGIGKSAVMSETMAVSQHFIAWVCDNNKLLDSWFLYNWLQMYKPEFERQAVGSTIKTIGLPFFKKLKILAPPFSEQRKIAKILSTWDKAISATELLIDNSKQQKKALMQQLLTGKKRLLDESGKPFEGEWEEVELDNICRRVTEKNNGQSTNVVTISAQHGLIRQDEFFKKSVASEILDNYFILRRGQFAYNKSYSKGYPMGAIKRLNRYKDAVVTSLYICFEVTEHLDTNIHFLEQYFESGLLNHGLTRVAAEGGRAHGLLNVKPSDFMALKLKLPNYSEQQKIAAALINADKKIELIEKQLADLQQEKKSLMQQLLTGKRRVDTETKNFEKGCQND